MMEVKKSNFRLSKDDLLKLLHMDDSKLLAYLNRSEFSIVTYLENRKYTNEDNESQFMEIIVQIISQVCLIKRESLKASLMRFLKMLKKCQYFLFDDVPRLIYSVVAQEERQHINLIDLMINYMNILKILLTQDSFPSKRIINNIFPTLENYMNRLRERRIVDLDKAEVTFRELKRKIDFLEEPDDINSDEEDVYQDFRTLSIVPRSNDIINYEIPNIPQNIIDRPYKNVDHFLGVHYRLMREDMLRSYRECVKMCLSPNSQGQSQAHVYESVHVLGPPNYSVRGIIYDVKVISSKEVDWGKKEVLLPGSLVFLTPDSFNTVVFATVNENARTYTGKSKEISIKIKLEDDQFRDELLKDISYMMIEPSAYFECYKHVLSAIKDYAETTFPLADIIAYLDYDDPEPRYMDEFKEYCLHETCSDTLKFEESCSCKIFNPLNDDEWPTSSDLKLDEMQHNAFKIALTKKVAVIQGPPGTGKTFIGVKVVKSLLVNVSYKPIVICCLTNHALDQFLERMLKYTKKIIRLGGQSKSEVLEPHKLDNMIYAIRQSPEGEIVHNLLKKSFDLVKKIAGKILKMKIEKEHDPQYYEIKAISKSINEHLDTYSRCQDRFLEDSALNHIIDGKYKDQLRRVPGAIRKPLNSGVLEWLVCSRSADLYEKCQKKFQQFEKRKLEYSFYIEDLWALTETKRYELFYFWRKKCLEICKRNLADEIEVYKTHMQVFKDKVIDAEKLELIKGADIVGVTTTGASKYRDLLRYADPRILVIEEAAQVLESHVIASLVPSIQHLILIGDHEQLRPLPANNELSEKYNLKVSMFERLFNNKAPSATLVLQHRMKPCIAELLVPRPYSEYRSYENVYKYEEINGVQSSVFFFDHREREDNNSSGFSSSNDFEARMVVNFAKYLIFTQYSTKQITILGTYAAQIVLIHKYLQIEKLNEIHVTTVDNFQGEENDIIILSFVRSNESIIGFLKESNRVCVALSRARKGMFCFGNFDLFARKNNLWSDIVEKLRAKDMIGEIFDLKCFRHQITYPVKSPGDIQKFLATGCREDCNFKLPCMHMCTRKCHFVDPEHLYYLCKMPCERKMDDNRTCPRLCYEKCKRAKKAYIELPCGHFSSRSDSKCLEEVTIRLPCHHVVTIPCHLDIKTYMCRAIVNITLDCGHVNSIRCHEQKLKNNIICSGLRQVIGPCGHTIDVLCCIDLKDVEIASLCNKACGSLLDCQHPCVGLCRVCFDTGIHAFCSEKCDLILTCGHKCEGYCGSPCPPCKQKCFLSCGHRFTCINDCLRSCTNCEKPCLRVCTHKKCTKLCWEDCNIDPCIEPCDERLPCGHRCIGLCGEPCPYLCCECKAECLKYGNDRNKFYIMLECEHVIEVNEMNEYISDRLVSFEWPNCPECSKPLSRTLRYRKELMKAKKICIDSCDTSEDVSTVHYLIESMYGIDYIVPASFIPVNNEILRILKHGNPQSHTLVVLKNCIIYLKKLHIISSKINELNPESYFQGRFDTLMLWIHNHLTNASFQQLKELEIAVNQLKQEVMSTTCLRLMHPNG